MALLGFSYLKQIINPEIETGEENFPNPPFSLSVLYSRDYWLSLKIAQGNDEGKENEEGKETTLLRLRCNDDQENKAVKELLNKYGFDINNPLIRIFSTAVAALPTKISDVISITDQCLRCFKDLEVLKTEIYVDLL